MRLFGVMSMKGLLKSAIFGLIVIGLVACGSGGDTGTSSPTTSISSGRGWSNIQSTDACGEGTYVQCPTGTVYYVSNAGDDNNDGLTPETAWRSLVKVNATSLLPGDAVRFRRGDVWRDVPLKLNSSGTSQSPILFGAYGSGNKPRLLGSNQVSGWTLVTGDIWQASLDYNPRTTSYGAELFCELDDGSALWTLNVPYDAGFANMTQDLDWSWNANTVYLRSTLNPDLRCASVEAPQQKESIQLAEQQHIAIDNLEIAYNVTVGIGENYQSSQINGLNITNSHIHHIGHKDSAQGFGLSVRHSNMYIAANDIHDCGRRAISLVTYNYTPAMSIDNILIEDNYLHDGWHTTGVDLNTIGDHSYSNVVIRNNYFNDPVDTDVTNDPVRYPNKDLSSNLIFASNQYPGGTNTFTGIHIYDNIFNGVKGFAVLIENIDDIDVRYNTFYGFNKSRIFSAFVSASGTGNLDVRNNLFYNDGNLSSLISFHLNDLQTYQNTMADNNFYYHDSAVSRLFLLEKSVADKSQAPLPGQQYVYYTDSQWSDYVSVTGFETHSAAPQNPLFADAANDNFQLQNTSPVFGRAEPVAGITTDYRGNPRDAAAPTVGAFE